MFVLIISSLISSGQSLQNVTYLIKNRIRCSKIVALIVPEKTVTKIFMKNRLQNYGQTKFNIAPLFQSRAINRYAAHEMPQSQSTVH